MIHARALDNIKRCPRQHYYQDTIGIKTVKNKNYFLSLGVKGAIRNWSPDIDTLDQVIPDHPFFELEKEEELEHLSLDLKRYFKYMGNKKPDIVSISQDINVGGRLITVSADMIFITGNVVEVVKVKRGKPKLSYSARTNNNRPNKNIDLFLMQLMGEHLYPGKIVVASYHHLASKGDKKDTKEEFESKPGRNIIKYTFQEKEERDAMFSAVKDTLKDIDNIENLLDKKGDCYNCQFNALCSEQKEKVKLRRVRNVKKADEDVLLTHAQRAAITFTKGGLRINAGAGSGKTTVIALRVVELIMDGCDPKDILTITFTNKGAKEMEEKIEYWLKREGVEYAKGDIRVTTFNGWGDQVIQDNYLDLGFSVKPRIAEKVEKFDILMEILNKSPKLEGFNYRNPLMDYKYSKGVLPKLNNAFDFIKSQLDRSPNALIGQVDVGMEDEIFGLFEDYQKAMSERGLIDYQDQIRLVLDLMDDKPEAFKNEDYKHVIIDEYQDTDEQQVELLMFLANQPKFESIMVVGDDAQSIYGFRNTSKENLMDFHKKFGDVRDIKLEDNFRSTPEIIDLANYINDLNTDKIEKQLISGRRRSGIKPEFWKFDTKNDEYKYVADSVAKFVANKNVKNSEIAVIARTKFELFELENLLLERNVPYVIDIPEPIINHPKVTMANHLLVFIEDGETTQGMFEYLVMSGATKDKTHQEILDMIEDYKDEFHPLTDDEKLEKFYSMMDKVNDEVLEIFFSGIKERNLGFLETISYIRKFIRYEDKKSIEKSGDKYNAVTLTTAHTSKGKEFDNVFVLMSKYVPTSRTLSSVEEERRTFYVSITRAKKKLFMTSNLETGTSVFEKEVIESGSVIINSKVTPSASGYDLS